jgi:hypothetical protein
VPTTVSLLVHISPAQSTGTWAALEPYEVEPPPQFLPHSRLFAPSLRALNSAALQQCSLLKTLTINSMS